MRHGSCATCGDPVQATLGFARAHACALELVEVRAIVRVLAGSIEACIRQRAGRAVSLPPADSAGEYFTFADEPAIELALMNRRIKSRDACK
jgi:hypothetical protein